MKLSLKKLCVLVLALTSLPAFAAGEMRLIEKSGWSFTKLLSPTRFQFNRPVAGVTNVTNYPGYSIVHPLSKISVHVLQLTDKKGRVVAIAEEYVFAWRSIIQLKWVGADKREVLVGTITESLDPDSPYQNRYSVSDAYGNPVAKGFDDRQEGEVVGYQFTHGGRDEAKKNTASTKINEWTLDVRDDRVVSPLLIASLITFKKAASYRNTQLFIAAGIVVIGGVTYYFGSTIKDHVKKILNKLTGPADPAVVVVDPAAAGAAAVVVDPAAAGAAAVVVDPAAVGAAAAVADPVAGAALPAAGVALAALPAVGAVDGGAPAAGPDEDVARAAAAVLAQPGLAAADAEALAALAGQAVVDQPAGSVHPADRNLGSVFPILNGGDAGDPGAPVQAPAEGVQVGLPVPIQQILVGHEQPNGGVTGQNGAPLPIALVAPAVDAALSDAAASTSRPSTPVADPVGSSALPAALNPGSESVLSSSSLPAASSEVPTVDISINDGSTSVTSHSVAIPSADPLSATFVTNVQATDLDASASGLTSVLTAGSSDPVADVKLNDGKSDISLHAVPVHSDNPQEKLLLTTLHVSDTSAETVHSDDPHTAVALTTMPASGADTGSPSASFSSESTSDAPTRPDSPVTEVSKPTESLEHLRTILDAAASSPSRPGSPDLAKGPLDFRAALTHESDNPIAHTEANFPSLPVPSADAEAGPRSRPASPAPALFSGSVFTALSSIGVNSSADQSAEQTPVVVVTPSDTTALAERVEPKSPVLGTSGNAGSIEDTSTVSAAPSADVSEPASPKSDGSKSPKSADSVENTPEQKKPVNNRGRGNSRGRVTQSASDDQKITARGRGKGRTRRG